MTKQSTKYLNDLLRELPAFKATARELLHETLANLVMIGEAAAPTFKEERRVKLILERFAESGFHECGIDEKGNGIGVLRGTGSTDRNFLLVSNADSISEAIEEPNLEVMPDSIVGPFVGDNSLALAAMISVPRFFEKIGVRLNANLIALAAVRSLGRGNFEGLNFFLRKKLFPVDYGICLDGVQLGRLNYKGLGMLRGEVICRLPDDYNWASFGSAGTIVPMSEIICRIGSIPLPRRPLTNIVMGAIRGGAAYHSIARKTVLSFEVRSESDDMLKRVERQLGELVEEVAAGSGVDVSLEIFLRRKALGLKISHPLVRCARKVLTMLDIKPMMYSTTSALSTLLSARIPAITLGFTIGERLSKLDEMEEAAFIEPMAAGMAQLAGMLLAMDGGCCDDS